MPPKRNKLNRSSKKQNDSVPRSTRSANTTLLPGLGVTSATNQGRSTRHRGGASPQRTPTAQRIRSSRRPVGQRGVVTRGRELSSESPARLDVVQNVSGTMPTVIVPPAMKAMESVEEDSADIPSPTADKTGMGEGGTWKLVVASCMRMCVFAHVCICAY